VGRSERGSTVANCYAEANIVLAERNVGGLLGCSNATVTDCRVISDVIGSDYCVGGLVGWYGSRDTLASSGVMTGCHSSSSVIGGDTVGGLAGWNRGRVTDCHASGSVNGDSWVGGLAGSSSGVITDSFATADVLGTQDVGGLVGYGDWESRIERCYATGEVVGNYDVGGLLGGSGYYSSISDCYAMGNVSGGRRVGGLVGHCSSVVNCYSAGIVRGDEDVGGLVGKRRDRDEIVEGCFWDIDTSGQPESAGGSAKTTADMYRATTFLGWGGDVWTIDDGDDYPRLWWEEQPGQVIQTVEYPTGAGTADDPFLIYTAEEMAIIGWTPSNWDKYFKLMADIDLAAFMGNSFEVIGHDENNAFTGVFDGDGHTISNFTYRSLDKRRVGLFGIVYGTGAEVKNLGLIDPNVETGRWCFIGGLVGNLCEGRVTNCYVDGGTVSGVNYAVDASSMGDAVPVSVGGLVGYNLDGCIVNCYSTATTTGERHYYSVGGLVGYNSGTVATSYAAGIVVDEDDAGGLIGGGSDSTTSFWDIDTSGQTESNGGTGLTTAEMQDIDTYLDAGWDFIDETRNGTTETWYMPDEGGYPQLTVFAGYAPLLPDGEGTATAPYLISDANELGSIGHRNTACYRLDADIDLSDIIWTTAVVCSFSGHFDGKGHVIRNLQIQGDGHLGLFGCVTTDAVVTSIHLEHISIESAGDYVGGLAGRSGGRISDCFSRGSVIGNEYVGGLIGFLGEGSLSTSRSAGAVVGVRRVGGLVGYSDQTGILSNCYCTNSVIGGSIVGGLIGQSAYRGSVSYCYSAGPVAGEEYIGGFVGNASLEEMQACFWDMETSSQTSSRWAVGLTTAEMQTAATFVEAGWDFVGEVENGTEEIWWIDEGQDYPREF